MPEQADKAASLPDAGAAPATTPPRLASRPHRLKAPAQSSAQGSAAIQSIGWMPPPETVTDILIRDPLRLQDGTLWFQLCGYEQPLIENGQPVASFSPAWRATALFTGFAPLFLLELVRDDGQAATWFLDYRLHRVAGTIGQLPLDLLELLKQQATALLHALMHQVLESCMPALDARLQGFLGLNEQTRQAIVELCARDVVRRPAIYLASDLMPHSLVYRGQDGRLHAIDQQKLTTGLAEDWQQRIAGFVRTGRLSWPSPVDGLSLMAQGSLPLDELHDAYRIVDHRNALVFFVLVGGRRATLLGLWFPTMGLLVAPDGGARRLAASLVETIEHALVSLAVLWGAEMVPYLARGATRFASVVRGPPANDLGQQLRNELGGIERLLRDHARALPRDRSGALPGDGAGVLPEWIVLDPTGGAEPWGPLDALYDELKGRVNRTLRNDRELLRHIFSERVFLLRVSGDVVTAALRSRLLAWAAASPEARVVVASLPRLRPAPVVVVGLRVGNRTLVDIGEFLTRFVAFMVDTYPGATIVFDGHNVSDADASRRSSGETGIDPSLIEIERAIVDALREAFAAFPVRIVDTIGTRLVNSLAWTAASDVFVGFWGSGLVKYRWACNKPGYIITGRTNLLNLADLHVYDSPGILEGTSPVRFANADLVTDQPGAPLLVPASRNEASRSNFSIDNAGVLAEIREMIDRIMAGRRVG